MTRTQVTEQTAKRWKAVQGCGCLLMPVGFAVSFLIANAEPGYLFALGMGLVVLGLMAWIGGRIAAWWFHG